MKLTKNRKLKLITKYTVTWLICTIIIFTSFIIWRRHLVIRDDGFNIYYPAMAYIREWFIDVLHGHVRLFDFNIGFGDDVLGALSCLGIGDILVLPFCFVPVNLLELSYSASIMIRLFLAGLVFLFLLDDDISDSVRIGGALLYSFCPYAFTYSFSFLLFATPMVWLPLIAMGVKDILRGKALWSKKLFFGVLFLSMIGFYFIYMAIIAFGLYLLIDVCFSIRDRSFSAKVRRYLAVVGTTLLGICTAGVFLMPLVILFLQSPRTGNIVFSLKSLLGFSFHFGEMSRNIFTIRYDNIVNNGTECDLFRLPWISILSVVSVCFLIHHHKKINKTRLMVIGIVAIIGIISNGANSIMNAFSIPYIRYHILIFLVLSYITAVTIPYFKSYWNQVDAICVGVIVAINIFTAIKTNTYSTAWIWTILYILFAVVLLLLLQFRRSSTTIAFMAILWVIAYGYLYNAPFEKGGYGFVGFTYGVRHEALDAVHNSKLYDVESADDFARYDLRGASLNASLMLNKPTTYSYYSICNGSMLSLLSEYGVTPSIQGTFIYQGLDERQPLESVLSVTAYNNGTNEDEVTYNECRLPLGIGYNRLVRSEELQGRSQIEKQELSSYMAIINDEIELPDNTDVAITSGTDLDDYLSEHSIEIEDLNCLVNTGDTISITDDSMTVSGSAVLGIDFDNSCRLDSYDEVYLVLPDFYSNDRSDILIDNKVMRIVPQTTESSYLPNYDRYINITDLYEDGRVDVIFDGWHNYHYTGARVLIVRRGEYYDAYEELKANSMKDISIDNNSVSGTVDNDIDVMMLYSIPYSQGWKAYIDGIETDLYRSDYGLMSAYVPKGHHDIILRYRSPGIFIGGIMSILGMIMFIALEIINRYSGA
ncbi:YfhO family protein [Butyrivibrio fibrisolvens]|uniref:YfhO family protein n=1 Tax=Butyrivibrio fibrisolvens TaxID=831 RepID=UPI0003B543E4|nr:YfhO family protein [Butyrivibrio fibrisolvens]